MNDIAVVNILTALAAVMLIAFGVHFSIQRRRKARRARTGRCPKCGYNRFGLGAGVVCPECGFAAAG